MQSFFNIVPLLVRNICRNTFDKFLHEMLMYIYFEKILRLRFVQAMENFRES